jgi:SAM-dependent methyltransferase
VRAVICRPSSSDAQGTATKTLDRLLQRWRITKARPFVPFNAKVLDVGCADAALFKILGHRVSAGLGIDPDVEPAQGSNYRIVRGLFPRDVPDESGFDTITALAVLEHIPEAGQPEFAQACFDRLRPGGCVVITVPHPFVDRIIDVLKRFRVLDGMADEEHYGFDPRRALATFEAAGLTRIVERRFQLGLNNLFVFARPRAASSRPA